MQINLYPFWAMLLRCSSDLQEIAAGTRVETERTGDIDAEAT